MNFRRSQPSPALQRFVRFYWIVEDSQASSTDTETVIPDGCMEMIFHFGAPCRSVHAGGREELHPEGFVGGQITQSIRIRPSGPLGMLGVRFHPWGARPLLRLPMDAIAGRTVAVTDVFGSACAGLTERLAGAASTEQRFSIVDSFLLGLAGRSGAVHPLAHAAIAALTRAHGRRPVQALADELHVSARHLNRTLCRQVGVSAKAYARIVRLQFALNAIQSRPGLSLTEIAHAAGYFDQSHFNRDFRDLCGASPGAFSARSHTLLAATRER